MSKKYELAFKSYSIDEKTIEFFKRPNNTIESDLIVSQYFKIEFKTFEQAKECIRDLQFHLPNYKKSLVHKFRENDNKSSLYFMALANKQIGEIILRNSNTVMPNNRIIMGFTDDSSLYEVITHINRIDLLSDKITNFD